MWTFKASPITEKDIWSSLRLAFRNTRFRRNSKHIQKWITETTGEVTRVSVEQMLRRCDISVTTFAHFEWLVGDIIAKHYNYHNMVVLPRTHVEPVEHQRRYSRSTGSTVYPRGIRIKNIRKVVTTTPRHEVVTTTPRHEKAKVVTTNEITSKAGWGKDESGWSKPSKKVVTTNTIRSKAGWGKDESGRSKPSPQTKVSLVKERNLTNTKVVTTNPKKNTSPALKITWDESFVTSLSLSYYDCENDDYDEDDDERSQSSCESIDSTISDTGYSKKWDDNEKLEKGDITSFVKALSGLKFEDKQYICCPCGNNMEKWRERNAQEIVSKGNRYHCGSKSRPLQGMMDHAKDICIQAKCPLHLAFYLRLAHFFEKKLDDKLYEICASLLNK